MRVAAEDKDEGALVIDFPRSKSACAGAAAAFLLRKIAARAGSYAPGIEEKMFNELERREGGLDAVQSWIDTYADQLTYLGYRFITRRVAFRTDGILGWVQAGEGFRGALLPTEGKLLHPDATVNGQHAVALIADDSVKTKTGVVMVDPWPGTEAGEVPRDLDTARLSPKFASLLIFWGGYS